MRSDHEAELEALRRRIRDLEGRLGVAEWELRALRAWTGLPAEKVAMLARAGQGPAAGVAPVAHAPVEEQAIAEPVGMSTAIPAGVPHAVGGPPPLPAQPEVGLPHGDGPRGFAPIVRPGKSAALADLGAAARAGATAVAAPRPRLSLEAQIGKNWAAWVGGVVLFLGVAFFLKYAWDQGWIRPSPEARVIATVIFGIALGGVGEWLYRKPMRGLAGVLYGVGLAVTMAGFVGAHTFFEPPVLGPNAAAICVAVTAGAGIALALRADLMGVAILALLGAYLSPLILGTHEDKSLALLSYLGALAAVGWGLGIARPRWMGLRAFVWVCSFLWYALWWFNPIGGIRHDQLAIGWLCIIYGGFLAEMFFALQREFREAPLSEAVAKSPTWRIEANIAVLSMLNTIATAGALYLVLESTPKIAGAAVLGLAGVQALVALATWSKQMRYSAMLQAMALATMAVPLLLNEFVITIAWLVMAVAMGVMSRRSGLRWPRAWAVALWVLAMGRVVFVDFGNATLARHVWTIGGEHVTVWLLMAWGMAAGGHVLGWMGPRQREKDPLGVVLAAAGTVVILMVTTMAWGWGDLQTLEGAAVLIAILGLREPGQRLGYATHAGVLAGVLAAKWVIADGMAVAVDQWSGTQGAAVWPVLNLACLNGLLLAGAFAWLGWDGQPGGAEVERRRLREAAWTAAGILLFALLNFELLKAVGMLASARTTHELEMAKQVSLSVLWAVVAFGAIIAGFTRHLKTLRYAGLGLLGVTLLKILIVDMADVETVWRILSFTAVGALLLGVSFVYYRFMESRVAGGAPGGD